MLLDKPYEHKANHLIKKWQITLLDKGTMPLGSPSTSGEGCKTAGEVEILQSCTPNTNIGIEMVSQGGLLPTKQSFRFLYDVGAWSILEDGNFLKLTSRQEK